MLQSAPITIIKVNQTTIKGDPSGRETRFHPTTQWLIHGSSQSLIHRSSFPCMYKQSSPLRMQSLKGPPPWPVPKLKF